MLISDGHARTVLLPLLVETAFIIFCGSYNPPPQKKTPLIYFFEVKTLLPYMTFESYVVLPATGLEQKYAGGYKNLVCDTESPTILFSNATIFKKNPCAKPVTTRFVVGTGWSITVYFRYPVLEKCLVFLKHNITDFVFSCFAEVGNKSPVRENSYLQLHPGQSHWPQDLIWCTQYQGMGCLCECLDTYVYHKKKKLA